ncbi:hypothetical protein [Xanthomonas euvesicatoria]|uniref:Uncharacterized protein n=1 Tax=Xanthomonas euvesicatoria TaxID=456327 RepID=A0AAW3U0Y0_XANEU|nr:hypothetical protein [Xanthomonas euvesicatoria]MBB4722641.1 hypothetical protein [Xanthomonas euvesicatoria]MBB4869234.1 hypothetical protein [Xanthomonas euvesicatoria]
MNIPLTAGELIDELARIYPEVIYDPDQDREEFLLKSGERRLVLRLLVAREQEREESRGGHH